MSWGSKTSATQLTSITATEQFFSFGGSTLLTLNPGESADVQVSVTWPGSPVDDAIVSVYGTLDASTPTYDLTPYMQMRVPRSPSPDVMSFIVSDLYGFRIGIKRSGSTTTITSADCSYRKNGLNL